MFVSRYRNPDPNCPDADIPVGNLPRYKTPTSDDNTNTFITTTNKMFLLVLLIVKYENAKLTLMKLQSDTISKSHSTKKKTNSQAQAEASV